MRKLAVVLGVVLLVLIGAYAYLSHMDGDTPSQQRADSKTYQNDRYGVSFTYPNGYVLTEGEHGEAGSGHYAIVLIRDEDAMPRENSEGPPGITMDIYENPKNLGLVSWVKSAPQSNFTLSDGTYASTTVVGKDAVAYHWSGLYEAENTAFIHGGTVVSVVVTHLTNSDPQIEVYSELLSSIRLKSPAGSTSGNPTL